MVSTSPFWAGRAGSGASSARVLPAQELELLVHGLVGRHLGWALELEALVVHVGDVGLHLEARLVRERRRLIELARLDLRLVDGLDVLLGQRLRERVVDDRVDDVADDLRPVEVRKHLPRRLAGAKAANVRLPLEVRVRLLDLARTASAGISIASSMTTGEMRCDLNLHGGRGG